MNDEQGVVEQEGNARAFLLCTVKILELITLNNIACRMVIRFVIDIEILCSDSHTQLLFA